MKTPTLSLVKLSAKAKSGNVRQGEGVSGNRKRNAMKAVGSSRADTVRPEAVNITAQSVQSGESAESRLKYFGLVPITGRKNAAEQLVNRGVSNKGPPDPNMRGQGGHEGIHCVEESPSESDSESSSSCLDNALKKPLDCFRIPYTAEEDRAILKFVLIGNNINRTGSLSLWRELETKMLKPRRTYQSLKNRFLRNIKPHIRTKYRSFLTNEEYAAAKRKFPELKGKHVKPVIVREPAVARHQVPVAIRVERADARGVGPCAGNIEQNELPEENAAMSSVRIARTIAVNGEIGSSREGGTADGRQVVRMEESEKRQVIPAGSSTLMETSTAGTMVVPHTNHYLPPVHSFHCTKIINSLDDKTNLNLNILLVNDRSSDFLKNMSGPVKVDIVVSISAAQSEVEKGNMDTMTFQKAVDRPAAVKKRKKRLKQRPIPKTKSRRKYILRLKKRQHQKHLNLDPKCRTLALLLRKMECNGDAKGKSNVKSTGQPSNRMLLRSHVRKRINAVDDPASQNSMKSQETNCSVEYDSDYSEMYRKVAKNYQIVIEPDSECEYSSTDDDSPRKNRRNDKEPEENKILLRNMVGMMSSPTKILPNKQNHSKNISARL